MRRNHDRGEFSRARGSATASTRRERILVVDDEPDACQALQQVLQAEGYDARAETSALRALVSVTSEAFDLVLADVSMPEMSGLDLCDRLAELQPKLPVVMVTGRGDTSVVVAALRLGARDFLTKPVDAHALLSSVSSVLADRAPKRVRLPGARDVASAAPALAMAGCLGRSPAILAVYAMIRNLAGSLASVVIQGETGSGKEIIARALHESSRLRDGPFVSVDCAAIPSGLLESEFFGHARGAFTDARTARTGLLPRANGGTLLLDEIGELPLALQPKLLRALQERRVRPVGQNSEVPFDCRIIAATNRDLEQEVAAGRFREDLYYRLSVVPILVPPLRERGDDVLLLAEHFLARFAKDRKLTLGVAIKEKLVAYDWPGNIRELENCLERGAALAKGDELGIEDLPEKIQVAERKHGPAGVGGSSNTQAESSVSPSLTSLSEFERAHILKALELLHGNKTRAAAVLGIDRRTLSRRLEEYQAADPT